MATLGASCFTMFIEMQSMSVPTHPACLSRRVAHNKGVGGYCFGDYSPCADECKFADVMTTYNGGVGSNAGAASDLRLCVLSPPVYRTSWVDDVGENARGTKENIVVAGHAGVEAHIVLHFYVFAEAYSGRYHHVLSDVAAVAEFGFGHDVREMPDFDAGPDAGAWVDHRGGVNKCCFVNHM